MTDTLSQVFAALADPTRRGLYERLLASANGCTATELTGSARVSRQAIVKHLQVLARSGLAAARRDGREVRYFVATHGTTGASTWLLEREAAWDRRLAALGARTQASSHPTVSTDSERR
jgi:DNA-binding transcriptional ArsR family regulator